ncbi:MULTISPECIES: PIN domain-containing protein [unclassified Cryobacterium]|uniref:PIN domain-containing protein n=1 Tax=unclassified Cryobacterium TaxID=2649013 RepID=UPI00106C678A|nr:MULTISPECIES: PIN domain-containing protein [unclassified Cryobacterium]TFC54566.1 hypothetical protein E3O68_09520 [Cryobacterium sp. TMB3-1-2]TFC70852.1 hypothetical protein E3T21_09110 [Cryobacterium sp. TMB3-15]TFC77305.1 hypothetical protein E3T22_06230 [Cryobacterium sp. TMB3-10]TFD45239.1 hypothetical protein E3T58_02855 [Cryobacterium sp. TMB3-12]
MLVVVLDANALVTGARLRSNNWEQLAVAVAAGTTRVLIPRVALAEAKSRFMDLRSKVAATMLASAKRATAEAKKLIEEAARITDDDACAYGAELDARVLELGFEILATPSPSHDEIAQRAIDRRPPFDENGGGYRDTLHWHSILTIAATHAADDIVLVSADKGFMDSSGGLSNSLSVEVASILSGGTIAIAKSISLVALPGKYRGEPFRPDLDSELIAKVEDLMFRGGHLASVELFPPAFDLPSAESMTVTAAESWGVASLEARELEGPRVLELRFEVVAIVDIDYVGQVDYEMDGTSITGIGHAVKKLSFIGTAFTDRGGREVVSIQDLAVEVFRPKANVDALLRRIGSLPIGEARRERSAADIDRMSAFLAGLPEASSRRTVAIWPAPGSQN